jgi:hypothetical protein
MRCATLRREMRYTLSLGFEEHSETMFKLLNDQAYSEPPALETL